MDIENFYYKSSNLKENIYATVFKPDNIENSIGIIQVVHGMCEHMKKYEEFAYFMTLKGFIVCGQEHLGHGKTAGLERLGKLNDTDTSFNFVRDIRRLHNIIRNRYGKEIPYFILGHSMGSFIVRLYMEIYSTNDIESVVLCGTIGTQRFVDKGIRFLDLNMNIKGSGSSSKILEKLLLKRNNSRTKFNRIVYEMLNSNNLERERIEADPYCNFLFSNKAFHIMLSMISRISKDKWYKSIDKNLRILLISGELDAVGSFGNGVREVYTKLCDVGVKNVMYKLYKDARHEILTEKNRLSVFEDIYEFFTEDFEE